MTAFCVTYGMTDVKTCVIPGEHTSWCDGFARRVEVAERYDRVTRVTHELHHTQILDSECKGCLPAEAESGALCGFHGRQGDQVLADLLDLIVHLWSLNGSPPTVSEGRSGGFGSQWTLTESRIAANELAVALWAVIAASVREGAEQPYLHPWLIPATGFRIDAKTDTVAVIVRDIIEHLTDSDGPVWKRQHTAAAMIRLIRVTRQALHRFPTVDRPHTIPVLRCRRCDHMALEWRPPLFYRDDDRVVCRVCGAVEDRNLIEHDMLVILQERKKR